MKGCEVLFAGTGRRGEVGRRDGGKVGCRGSGYQGRHGGLRAIALEIDHDRPLTSRGSLL